MKSQVLKANKKNNILSKTKIPLTLTLILLVVTTVTGTSSLQFIKPAMAAGTLTSVSVVPASNIINQRATYDIFLTTATTGAIKTIEMTFPSSFDLAVANRVIERSGIGSGSLSAVGSTLTYTVHDDQSIPAGTKIRLEIGRIVAGTEGSFTVGIKTLNAVDGTIDGPTNSGTFTIKSIVGKDVSPAFMKSKTLLDDPVGNSHGWNPNGAVSSFDIIDSDIIPPQSRIIINVGSSSPAVCNVGALDFVGPGFFVDCDPEQLPAEDARLRYAIVNELPENVVISSLSSSASSTSPSSPFAILQEDDTHDRELGSSPSLP